VFGASGNAAGHDAGIATAKATVLRQAAPVKPLAAMIGAGTARLPRN